MCFGYVKTVYLPFGAHIAFTWLDLMQQQMSYPWHSLQQLAYEFTISQNYYIDVCYQLGIMLRDSDNWVMANLSDNIGKTLW